MRIATEGGWPCPFVALGDFDGDGWARVHSELWKVVSEGPVRKGQKLRVEGVEGLILKVSVLPEKTRGGA